MPYTLAHPLFAAPLRRLGLPLSALAAGAMAPDLPLWATSLGLPVPAANAGYAFTHTLLGILTADLAIGLGMWWLWFALLRAAFFEALPQPVRDRVPSARQAVRPSLTALAVVLGAITHVGLDEFTHPGRWGAQHLPWLSQMHGGLPGTAWLQYGAGALGLAGIGLWCSWIVATSVPRPVAVPSAAARRVVQLCVVLGGAIAVADVAVMVATDSLHRAAFIAATRGVLTVLAGLALGSVVRAAIVPRAPQGPSGTG